MGKFGEKSRSIRVSDDNWDEFSKHKPHYLSWDTYIKIVNEIIAWAEANKPDYEDKS